MLAKARLIGPGVDRVWSADEGGSGSRDEGAALRDVQSAAAWLVGAMDAAGEKRLAALCVDVDGSSCSWLTAFSAAPNVVQAALTQAAAHAEGDGSSLVGAAAAAMLVKSETSVQALAVSDQPSSGGRLKLPGKAGANAGKPAAAPTRQRLAVLAMPDAPVRVLEDELDKAGYEARQTLSLWHAMCRAWDPGAPSPDQPLPEEGDAAVDSPATAILLIDPDSQRLVWAWSRGGRLIAGGVFRLRAIPRVHHANGTTALQTADQGSNFSRRFGAAPSRSALPDHALVVGQAEAGRLVLEWLAWSAELGQSPQRVVCIAPPPGAVSVDPLDDPMGLARNDQSSGASPHGPRMPAASLAEALSRAWPGATIDVGHDPDPLGLTLTRLSERVSLGGRGAESEPTDPRYSLTALSARACRADKRKLTWIAAALAVTTVLVGAFGWRVGRAASASSQTVEQATADRRKLLTELEPLIPNLMRERNPLERIGNETAQIRRGMEDVDAGRPIFAEVLRVVKALEGAEDVKVDVLSISTVGSVRLTVPNPDIGPEIFEKLKALPGEMVWTFSSPPPRNASEPRRVNFQGQWPDRRGVSDAWPTRDAYQREARS